MAADPDLQVRVAWPADAQQVAELQVRAWRAAYADLLPAQLLADLDPAAFAQRWRDSLSRPRNARDRVLVALAGADVRGLAVTGAATDPDADPGTDGAVEAFHVDPEATGRGHGSRLLQACADTLRADGFTRATTWVNSADDATRRFFVSAGWAPDGAHRELDLNGDGQVRVKQVRLHTGLTD